MNLARNQRSKIIQALSFKALTNAELEIDVWDSAAYYINQYKKYSKFFDNQLLDALKKANLEQIL